MILAKLDEAIAFALHAHAGQMRKAKDVPFVAHPLAVAMLLQEMDCGQDVVIAALLHDTVEDTDITANEVRARFGDSVADLVAFVTEPRGRWEYRKEIYIAQIKTAPFEAKIISAADKYHNLHNVYQQHKKIGDDVWEMFSRDKVRQAWFYRSVYAGILHNNPHAEAYPIFNLLGNLIDEVFA